MSLYTTSEAFRIVKSNTDKPLPIIQKAFKRAAYYLELEFPIESVEMDRLEEAMKHALDEPFDINIDV